MPFSPRTKATMFVKCARICCLCFAQCGVNIEAHHIVPEDGGGLDTEDNGIPVCFDCHADVGHYNDRHPRGNKFTPFELTARRDQVYGLVERGIFQAHFAIAHLHAEARRAVHEGLPLLPTPEAAPLPQSLAVQTIIRAIEKSTLAPNGLALRMPVISSGERQAILDYLLIHIDLPRSIQYLMAAASSQALTDEDQVMLVEATLRFSIISVDDAVKGAFMDSVPHDKLRTSDSGLLEPFFEDIIETLEQVQFGQVNFLTAKLISLQDVLPATLYGRYVTSLVTLADSMARVAKPVALHAIDRLPEPIIVAALREIAWARMGWSRQEIIYKLIGNHKELWPAERVQEFTEIEQHRQRIHELLDED